MDANHRLVMLSLFAGRSERHHALESPLGRMKTAFGMGAAERKLCDARARFASLRNQYGCQSPAGDAESFCRAFRTASRIGIPFRADEDGFRRGSCRTEVM